ncbi:hypothetical protein HK405_004222, partial [Cladochytrium tenue]
MPSAAALLPPPRLSATTFFTLVLSLLVLVSAAATALALPVPEPAAATAAPAAAANLASDVQNGLVDGQCGALTVVFARGTTEQGNVGSLVGPPFLQSLAGMVGAANLVAQGVDYPADVQGFLNGGDPTGSALMASLVQTAMTQCPATKVVMAGYSQGGQLVHNAAASLPASVTGAVTAAVIFGDPNNGTAVAGVSAAKTLVICHPTDNICMHGTTILPAHLTYGSMNAADAATFVATAAGMTAGAATSGASGSAGSAASRKTRWSGAAVAPAAVAEDGRLRTRTLGAPTLASWQAKHCTSGAAAATAAAGATTPVRRLAGVPTSSSATLAAEAAAALADASPAVARTLRTLLPPTRAAAAAAAADDAAALADAAVFAVIPPSSLNAAATTTTAAMPANTAAGVAAAVPGLFCAACGSLLVPGLNCRWRLAPARRTRRRGRAVDGFRSFERVSKLAVPGVRPRVVNLPLLASPTAAAAATAAADDVATIAVVLCAVCGCEVRAPALAVKDRAGYGDTNTQPFPVSTSAAVATALRADPVAKALGSRSRRRRALRRLDRPPTKAALPPPLTATTASVESSSSLAAATPPQVGLPEATSFATAVTVNAAIAAPSPKPQPQSQPPMHMEVDAGPAAVALASRTAPPVATAGARASSTAASVTAAKPLAAQSHALAPTALARSTHPPPPPPAPRSSGVGASRQAPQKKPPSRAAQLAERLRRGGGGGGGAGGATGSLFNLDDFRL